VKIYRSLGNPMPRPPGYVDREPETGPKFSVGDVVGFATGGHGTITVYEGCWLGSVHVYTVETPHHVFDGYPEGALVAL
jgi:hypothetical protein